MARLRKSGEFSANRMKKQGAMLRLVCDRIGQAQFTKVTGEVLDQLYRDLLAGDTPSGKPASGTYVRAVHGEISLVYRDAIAEGEASENPCDRAHPPRKDSKPRRAMPPQQVRDLVEQLEPADERDFAYLVAAELGLRRGEICGLSWGDVDLANSQVNIEHSYDAFKNLKETKTGAGMRTLPLTSEMKSAFEAHLRAQKERGIVIKADSPVILTDDRTRVQPDILGRWWHQDRADLGADGYCLHELRHSHISMLAVAGVHPKVMAEMAGHSDCKISLNVYSHIFMDAKRASADALEGVLESA